MNVVWNVSCFAHEQPDPDVWAALARVVDGYGAGPGGQAPPFMRVVTVDTPDQRDTLLARLRAVPDAVVRVGPSTRLSATDLSTAEFVAAWPAEERLTVMGVEETLAASGPCPTCGLTDSLDVVQQRPFTVVDDAVDGDVSALPAGGWAVSSRALGVLESVGATGFTTVDILVGPGSRRSARWFQLLAGRAVLAPCPVHTEVEGGPFCPTCGAAGGTVVGFFWVPPAVADCDVFARHPSLRTMLHLSRRVADALAGRGATDVTFTDVARVCRHPG